MNFIKIFGFFIGLFITLLLISYIKINEPFTNIEHSSIEPYHNKPMIINDNDDSILPYNGYKFMSINTYKDINKIVINDGKWYDIDNDDFNLPELRGFNYMNDTYFEMLEEELDDELVLPVYTNGGKKKSRKLRKR